MPRLLKLRACDNEDLAVIAALLQDALAPISEMAYLPEERRFVILLNRFRWEAAEPGANPAEDAPFEEEDSKPDARFERIHCGVCFDRVTAVRMRGIDPRARDRILELLTVDVEDEAIDLVFAGDARIRLQVEALRCRLDDLGEAWPTQWRPQHRFGEGGEDG